MARVPTPTSGSRDTETSTVMNTTLLSREGWHEYPFEEKEDVFLVRKKIRDPSDPSREVIELDISESQRAQTEGAPLPYLVIQIGKKKEVTNYVSTVYYI